MATARVKRGTSKQPSGLVQIGEIGIDAGMCYIGDPCYVIDAPLGRKNWSEFLTEMYESGGENARYWTVKSKPSEQSTHTFPAGIVTTTGEGDGCYPVYAELKSGRVHRIIINFY